MIFLSMDDLMFFLSKAKRSEPRDFLVISDDYDEDRWHIHTFEVDENDFIIKGGQVGEMIVNHNGLELLWCSLV